MDNSEINIIVDEINKYRNNLLDSSRRNKFLNFNPSKSKSIEIINENMLNLFDTLVLKEKPMRFLSFNTESDEIIVNKDNTWSDVDDEDNYHNDLYIQTYDSKDVLTKKLTKLARDNKSTIEEKGFNSLYLALGFLEWKDALYQNKLSKAPIILIPMKLTKVYDTYQASCNFEEVRYNSTLKYVFKDIGVNFPVFESLNSKADVKEYLEKVQDSIKNKKGWQILNEVYLSIFSFKKLAMYEDLELSNWKKLKENNIRKLYFNDKNNQNKVYDYTDSFNSQDNYNVLDADSSQQEVIQNIKHGVDLVVEGPPGTGKSQTIVNIIAELIAMNKSVLFVSEKKVALDVVKNRLDEVNLGDFCLELHGENYNKKAFIQELSRTISLKSADYNFGNVYNHLDKIKSDISRYAEVIYEEFGQTKKNAYDFIGLMDKNKILLKNNVINVKIEDVEEITPDIYDNILDNLTALSQQYASIMPLSNNYWSKTDTSNLNISEIDDMGYLIEDTTAQLDKISDLINNLVSWVGINLPSSYTIKDLLETSFIISDNLNNYSHMDEMVGIVNKIKSYKQISTVIPDKYSKTDLLKVKNTFAKYNHLLANSRFKNKYIYSKVLGQKIALLQQVHAEIENSTLRNLINDPYLDNKILLFEKYKNKSLLRLVNKDFENLRNQLRMYYNLNCDDEQIYHDLLQLSRNKQEYNNIRYEVNALCTQAMGYNELLEEYKKVTQYKQAMQSLKQQINCGKLTNKEFITEINTAIQKEQVKESIIKEDTRAKQLFANCWQSVNSNVDELNNVINQFNKFDKYLNEGVFTQKTVDFIKEDNFAEYDQLLNNITSTKQTLENSFDKLNNKIIRKDSKPFNSIKIKDYQKQKEQLRSLIDNMESINGYRIFDGFCKDYENKYTTDIIKKIRQDKIEPENIAPVFAYNFANESLKKIFFEDVLNKFNSNVHNQKIEDFKKFDQKVIENNRIRVRNNILKIMPDINVELSIEDSRAKLHKEITKKSKHLPIRKTLKETSDIITGIKPCFMMSPMSIAQYLNPEVFESFFDYVIFDEASQLKIEDAIGALLRAKNYIIMGDTRQLPPTTFFDSSLEIDDDDEVYSTVGIESILEHAKITLNTKMLKWHYRSRHDSLIAVSNNEFYNNQLYVYPSSQKSTDEYGLKLKYNPDTIYDKGRSASNLLEAEDIIEYLFDLLEKYGQKKSIGIATFSKKQRDIIYDLLQEKLTNKPEYSDYFDDNNTNFFIKNLENIQGDEKDIILISMGYGFDDNHQISMNFGPLNKDGGERRLNVLFTRAKEQSIIFSNFKSQDLRINKSSPKGVKSLKTFLYYAEKGEFPKNIFTGVNIQADFEKSVYLELVAHGYQVDKCVGTAGYKIDLAVVNPNNQDEYILAIECDGSSYHSSKSVRDRDRLRQQVLENLGWNFHRIWSADWYHNKQDALNRLFEKIDGEISKD